MAGLELEAWGAAVDAYPLPKREEGVRWPRELAGEVLLERRAFERGYLAAVERYGKESR